MGSIVGFAQRSCQHGQSGRATKHKPGSRSTHIDPAVRAPAFRPRGWPSAPGSGAMRPASRPRAQPLTPRAPAALRDRNQLPGRPPGRRRAPSLVATACPAALPTRPRRRSARPGRRPRSPRTGVVAQAQQQCRQVRAAFGQDRLDAFQLPTAKRLKFLHGCGGRGERGGPRSRGRLRRRDSLGDVREEAGVDEQVAAQEDDDEFVVAPARLRVERGVVDDDRPLAEGERGLDDAELRVGAGRGACDVVEEGVGLARVLELEDVGVGAAGWWALLAGHAG